MMLKAIGKFKGTESYGISFSNGVSFLLLGSTGYHRWLTFAGMVAALCLIICFFLVDKKPEHKWKMMAVLSLSMLGLVENCGKYMIIFAIIPWLSFFRTEAKLKLIDYVYVLMMTVMLAPLPLGKFEELQPYYDRNTMVICHTAIIMSVVLMLDILIDFIKTHKKDAKQCV
jgi:hypothetical protein